MYYEFKKWGTLIRHNGIPVYIGQRRISQITIVWWWPVNWIMSMVWFPVALYRALKRVIRQGWR